MLKELPVDPSEPADVEFLDEERTPAWLVRLVCAAHTSAASLGECSDLLAWFGQPRTRQAVWYWVRAYGDYHDKKFTAEPTRIAVDKKQVQLEEGEKVWLYAPIDVDSKVVLHSRLSDHRGTDPATEFLRELKENLRTRDAVFLVDGMGYLTALARTSLSGDLNYSKRNIVEKLFQTITIRNGFTKPGTVVRPSPSAG